MKPHPCTSYGHVPGVANVAAVCQLERLPRFTADYADDILRGAKVYEIYEKGLPAFYRAHQATLEKEPGSRELNGAMAIALLQFVRGAANDGRRCGG